jgi:hypothetical protein
MAHDQILNAFQSWLHMHAIQTQFDASTLRQLAANQRSLTQILEAIVDLSDSQRRPAMIGDTSEALEANLRQTVSSIIGLIGIPGDVVDSAPRRRRHSRRQTTPVPQQDTTASPHVDRQLPTARLTQEEP